MTRVLLVDDDASVRRLVQTVLERAGFAVVTAEDGQEALEKLDATIGVLLCDKNLPKLQGTQVVLEARTRFPRLATVLMTAAPEALSLTALGLDGYLAKPFRSNSLVLHTLSAAMERRAQAHKREALGAQLAQVVAGLPRRDR